MNEISNILAADEKVVWEGKPQYIPFIITYILVAVIAFLFLAFYGGAFYAFILGPIIAFGALFLGNFIYQITHYAITDKRVVLQSGIFGRDFKSIDYDKMQNTGVAIGLINYFFKTGNIKIFSGEIGSEAVRTGYGRYRQTQFRTVQKYDTLMNIENPQQVSKILGDALSTKKETESRHEVAQLEVLKSIEKKIGETK